MLITGVTTSGDLYAVISASEVRRLQGMDLTWLLESEEKLVEKAEALYAEYLERLKEEQEREAEQGRAVDEIEQRELAAERFSRPRAEQLLRREDL